MQPASAKNLFIFNFKGVIVKKILSIFIFLLLTISIFLKLNSNYIENYYITIDNNFRFINMPNDIEIVGFGDSHMQYAFGYEPGFHQTFFNMAAPSQGPYYDHALLVQYLQHFSKDAVLILNISYYTMYMPLDTDLEEQKPRLAQILDTNKIPNFTLKDRFMYEWFPLLSSQAKWSECLRESDEEYTYARLGQIDVDTNTLTARAQARADYHLGIGGTSTQTIAKEQISALNRFISFAYENGMRVILLITPYYHVYNDAFSSNFYSTFYQQIADEVLSLHSNVSFYDYSHDKRFCHNETYYFDGDHLNEIGRNAFIPIFQSEIIFGD